jgi:hypothetical protein
MEAEYKKLLTENERTACKTHGCLIAFDELGATKLADAIIENIAETSGLEFIKAAGVPWSGIGKGLWTVGGWGIHKIIALSLLAGIPAGVLWHKMHRAWEDDHPDVAKLRVQRDYLKDMADNIRRDLPDEDARINTEAGAYEEEETD